MKKLKFNLKNLIGVLVLTMALLGCQKIENVVTPQTLIDHSQTDALSMRLLYELFDKGEIVENDNIHNPSAYRAEAEDFAMYTVFKTLSGGSVNKGQTYNNIIKYDLLNEQINQYEATVTVGKTSDVNFTVAYKSGDKLISVLGSSKTLRVKNGLTSAIISFSTANIPKGADIYLALQGNLASTFSITVRAKTIRYGVNLSKYVHVAQHYVPMDFHKTSAFKIGNGFCDYPQYIGKKDFTDVSNTKFGIIQNAPDYTGTGICLISATIMATAHVGIDSKFAITPKDSGEKISTRLIEATMRLQKIYDKQGNSESAYDGNNLHSARLLLNGLSAKNMKGDLSNWQDCKNADANLNATTHILPSAKLTKNAFIQKLKDAFTLGKPCITGVTIKGRDASAIDYFDGEGSHAIVLFGIIEGAGGKLFVQFPNSSELTPKIHVKPMEELLSAISRVPIFKGNYSCLIVNGK